MKKRICSLLLAGLAILTLTACGNESELEKYNKEVELFYTDVVACNDRINTIDANTETASAELLEELDTLNELFKDFAELKVPREYASVESLADEASVLMDEAITQYHTAFAGEVVNDFEASLAYEKYCRAIVRINYIGDLLQGKKLEGEGINVIYEEASDSE